MKCSKCKTVSETLRMVTVQNKHLCENCVQIRDVNYGNTTYLVGPEQLERGLWVYDTKKEKYIKLSPIKVKELLRNV